MDKVSEEMLSLIAVRETKVNLTRCQFLPIPFAEFETTHNIWSWEVGEMASSPLPLRCELLCLPKLFGNIYKINDDYSFWLNH